MTEQKSQIQTSPFQGMQGFLEASKIVQEEKLRIAVLGKPKSGKSWFAATAPKPVAVYDFDNRAASLAGKEGVFVKTLYDKNPDRPTAMQQLEADLSMYQMKKQKGEPIPATFVLDTITYMKKCMENELYRQDSSLCRIIRVGSAKGMKLPKGWDVVNAVSLYMQYWLTELSALGHVIFVFHEKDEKDAEKSTPELAKYTGKVTTDPQYLAKLLTLFNEVFRIEVNGMGKYTVTCKPNYDVNASTTLLIDATEPPDLMQMLAKHRARIQQKKG